MDPIIIAIANRTDKVFCPGDNRKVAFKAGGIFRDADHGKSPNVQMLKILKKTENSKYLAKELI